jgi:dolichyl-phosphate-mannose-protein mannosyltransferase
VLRPLGSDAPLALVLAVMLLLGIYLRVRHFEGPQSLRWDEHHYVDTARGYLSFQYSDNDHPPLGKLIIAAVMHLVGDTPVGWRLASLVCGLCNVGLVGWITWTAFKSRRAAWLAAAFVAVDGFFIVYSRAGLLDGMIVAFGAAGVGTILVARRWWHVALAGFFVGCAASFKLNGVPFVAAAAFLCVVSRRLRGYTPLLLLLAAAVFYAQSALPLAFSGRPWGVLAVIAENRKLVHQHLAYTVVHPFSSHWFTWFLPLRPFFLRRDVDPVTGDIEALITLGNPLLWWASTLAVVAAAVALARAGWPRVWAQLRGDAPSPASLSSAARSPSGVADPLAVQDRAGVLFAVLLAWAGPLAFWVPSLRDAYLYHYLPSYTFALVFLAGFLDRIYAHRPRATFVAIVVIAEVSIFYAPVWAEMPLSLSALHARLFFPFWR